MAEAVRVAVLASGSGTNFQALLDAFGPAGEKGPAHTGEGPAEGPAHGGNGPAHAGDGPAPAEDPGARVRIALLVASRPGIGAVGRAERAGVPVRVLPERGSAGGGGEPGAADPEAAFLLDALRTAGADLVVLAGWLRLVPAPVVRAYRGRMVNVHPALLPAFGGQGMYGRHVHRAVLDSGVRVSGVTVHFVDEAYDRGPILAQWPVPVHARDDAATLADRVLQVEHRLLPSAVRALATGRVRLDETGACRWESPLYDGDRFLLDGGSAMEGWEAGSAGGAEAEKR